MRKILLVLFLIGIVFTPLAFADRNTSTIAGYSASTLVKRGDWKIYRITFIATSNSGNFIIFDSLTIGAGSTSNIKTEGAEATAQNGKVLDFSSKPLEGSTGLYLAISNANVVIEYE